MNELIKITEQNGNKVVSARELYQFLGYDLSQWSRWYQRNILESEFFTEGIDYQILDIMSSSNNGSTTKDFALTIDTAKEISMLARTEKGKQARLYFISCEKNNLRPRTHLEVIDSERALLIENNRISEQLLIANNKIEDDKPKVVFFDQVTGSESCFDMADVAKVCALGIGRNTLFQFLRESNILRENNTPYQQYVDSGYFRVIESKFNKPDGSVNINLKTVVYQKGINFIIKRFIGRAL